MKTAWGFSIKVPTTSAAEMTLPCPPPSTLIGALARGLAYLSKDWTECLINPKINAIESSGIKILKFVVSAHFGFPSKLIGYLSPWSDITHSYAIPYQQIQHRPKPEMWFGVHASGRVYAVNFQANIAYVVSGEEAEISLGKGWEDRLKKAGYCVQAIGVKEGLISVENVELKDVKLNRASPVKTSYYLPTDAIERYLPSNLYESEFWEHRSSSPHWRKILRGKARAPQETPRISYILPLDKVNLSPQEVTVHLSQRGVGLTADKEPENTVVLLKEWLD